MTLLRPRWVAGHLLVLALTASFIALGFWQLGRDHHKQDLVREAKAAYAAPAPDIASTGAATPGARAQASGVYDAAHEVLLRNQVHGGKNGDDVLTPLRLADGRAVMVDRGWVAAVGDQDPGPTAVASGPVRVAGIVNTSSALNAQDAVLTVGGKLALPASTSRASDKASPTGWSTRGSSPSRSRRPPPRTRPRCRNRRRPTR